MQKNIGVKRFYFRRFFKIIPQYYFFICTAIVCTFILQPFKITGFQSFQSHDANANYLSYFLLFQNYLHTAPMMSHTWSIAIEEHFYLLYPLLLMSICQIAKSHLIRHRLFISMTISLIILGNVIRYFYFTENSNPLLTHFRL